MAPAGKSPALPPALIDPAQLAHLVRFLSSRSGTDSTLMIAQYVSKIVVWALLLRDVKSRAATGLSKLSSNISSARCLFRFFGTVSTLQWLMSLEDPAARPASAASHLLQRMQAWSLMAYYPLEHLYYLGANAIVPLSPARITRAALWSTRFWAAYVVLEFLHLAERARLVRAAEDDLAAPRAGEKLDVAARDAELRAVVRTRRNIRTSLLVNTAYFPLTIQWSLAHGLWTNELWTGLFGTVAAIGGWRLGWRATA